MKTSSLIKIYLREFKFLAKGLLSTKHPKYPEDAVTIGKRAEDYTFEDIRREYNTKKSCAPYCTIACVHQVATFNNWRKPQVLPAKGAVRRESVQAIRTLYQIERPSEISLD